MMRLKLTFGDNEVTADVPATRANAYPVGMRVQARFPSARRARLLSLERVSSSSSGRSLKIPSTPRATSSRIRAASLTV